MLVVDIKTVTLPGFLQVTLSRSHPLVSLSLPICKMKGLDNGLKNLSRFDVGFCDVKNKRYCITAD